MNRKRVLTLFTILIVTFIFVGVSISQDSQKLSTLSKLRVSGNRIVNEEGQEIQLRGVNFTDPFVLDKDDLDGDGVPDNHFSEIPMDFVRVKALGANVVRLAIYPGYYRLVGGESYLTTYVDRMVDLAEKNGFYIILSYHAIGRPGGWYADADNMLKHLGYTAKVHYTDTDMAVRFWNAVADRYGQKKHVLFEIYNEPADDTASFTWADWRPTGELLMKMVRQHSQNIILGPGPNYSSDLSDIPKNPYSDPNIAYVAHVYPGTVWREGVDQVSEWERLFGFLAETYPVIVSEWGFHNGGDETTNGTLEGFGRPLCNYLDQKNLHWVAFVYHPPDAEPPMLEADWKTLNEFGKLVKERLSAGAYTIGPTIKANGKRNSATVTYPAAVTITVEMNPSTYPTDVPVDWWVVASANLSAWYYLNSSLVWTPFSGALALLQPVYQGPLFNLSSTTVLPAMTLPKGTYYFWFAVDYPADGVLDPYGAILYDQVTVISTTEPASSLFIYHGVATHSWSSLITPDENRTETLQAEVSAYEAAVGRTVSFIEFAHEWKTDGSAFPVTVATAIKNRGATPFIFLNLRSADVAEEPDPIYNLAAIISGEFDMDFAAWADAAKQFGSEIIVSWGWEMNGDWSAWSGPFNGGPVEGPKRFREAYRHIVELMRNRGADNIRWAFHINFPEYPDESWNAFENYYPGDDVIDLVGASVYGAQSPTDVSFPSFESLFDPAYSRLVKMTPQKPVFVFEFGAAANHPLGSSATWADDALSDILSGRWPTVRGFAWWNDYWSQDDNSAHDTEMRVEAVPGLAAVFKSRLSEADNVGDRPPIFSVSTGDVRNPSP